MLPDEVAVGGIMVDNIPCIIMFELFFVTLQHQYVLQCTLKF